MKTFSITCPVGDNGGVNFDILAENEKEALEKVKNKDFPYYSEKYKVEEAIISIGKEYSYSGLTEQQKRESVN